jgi:hypothetical protein
MGGGGGGVDGLKKSPQKGRPGDFPITNQMRKSLKNMVLTQIKFPSLKT